MLVIKDGRWMTLSGFVSLTRNSGQDRGDIADAGITGQGHREGGFI